MPLALGFSLRASIAEGDPPLHPLSAAWARHRRSEITELLANHLSSPSSSVDHPTSDVGKRSRELPPGEQKDIRRLRAFGIQSWRGRTGKGRGWNSNRA